MAYLYELATTYASFRPAEIEPARDLRRGWVRRGPTPVPPAPFEGHPDEASWSGWILFGTPVVAPFGGDLVLIWTWQRHRVEPEPLKKTL